MGVPASEVGYTSATTGRGDHEVHRGHVVALGKKISYVYSMLASPKNASFFYVGCEEYKANRSHAYVIFFFISFLEAPRDVVT
jgi:hypothetical protein